MSRRTFLVGAVALGGCFAATEPDGPVANVRGVWSYTGSQTTPALTLSGTLSVSQQAQDVIEGSLTWSEADGVTAPVFRSGSMAGLVIGETDVDFEVVVDAGSRRHLARISANGDTLVGVWVGSSGSGGGPFVAIRGSTP